MENVQETYTNFHKKVSSQHIYPTEWVIRTFLGKYPDLNLDKTKYPNAKLLDLGFGDCRNMPLLNNCNFDIHGVEITDDILNMAGEKLNTLGIEATLKRGVSASIPFENSYFDYLLACHSCYYVDKGTSFNDNIREIHRVLKSGGTFIASLPAPDNFILKDCIKLEDGHVLITNDIYNLRNGYIFRTFENEEEIRQTFSPYFKNIAICKCMDNFWGVQINFFIIACEKI
ncbi:class I SAM-dependent methyltransferase [Niastella caeni]|uniref:Class I SAM-dependent methyltransferase n=1 Tax=Niastella caeni TaxID=2569763 RepID=A0A4S8I0B5_9BACT|nr:class I SAM-dependent methyltransferase [Niastella caeni]THU41533.1 class I SAM-dependent methyltransferase [Niastella caeni]